MRFVTYVKVKCMATIAYRSADENWKYTILSFLFYMQSDVIAIADRQW